MAIEIDTFNLSYHQPLDGGAFLAGVERAYLESLAKVRQCFDVYGGVANRIIRERNLSFPETAHWQYVPWAGLMISIRLKANEGFDAMHEFYEHLSFQTTHSFARVSAKDRKADPDPEDYPDIYRRAWTFRIGEAHCTLCAIADSASDICRRVEVGTEPKYELVCAGSPLPTRQAAE